MGGFDRGADMLRALITEPGIYPAITPEQYFAEPCPGPALTNSVIKMLAPIGAAPAKAAHYHPAIGQPEEDRRATAAQYRGKLVHRLALDKGDDYAISPFDEYRSKEAKAWRAATEEAGVMPVKQAAYDEADAMAQVVRERISAACDGLPYQTEVVVAWQEKVALTKGASVMVWCRAMLDVWCPDLMLALDVKTCADAGDDALLRAFAKGYATQDCWYRRGVEKALKQPGRAKFKFLFVESEAPFLSRDGQATEAFRYGANFECERALLKFATCLHSGNWPTYSPFKAEPPAWLLNRWSAEEMEQVA